MSVAIVVVVFFVANSTIYVAMIIHSLGRLRQYD
jgi:hypothetical protein